MADIKLVGAVAIKVRPNAKGFRGETQRQVSKELAGVEAAVKVKVKGDTTELATDVEKAKKVAESKDITLKVGMDYDSVRRAQQALDKAVKDLSTKEIKVTLDANGIKKAQDELDDLMDQANVEMTFVPDEKGYKAVLDKIAEIRRQKIEQPISFSIDEESLDDLERDMRAALNNGLSEQFVTLRYNNNRESISKALDQVNAELDKIRQVEFDVTLDKKSLKTARKALEAALSEAPVELKVNYDDQESLKQTRDKIKSMLSELNAKTLNIAFNEEALRAELHRIDGMIKDEVEDKKRDVELPVHTTGLELVARQLQFASRARRVPFHVVIDKKSMIIAEGILRSLAGVNVLQSAGRGLENIITKFDTIALKGAGWSSAIGGLADSLTYLVSTVFAVGDGMFEVVGLLATAPAAIAAIAAATVIGTMAFDNMKKALNGDAEAMGKLPPAAQAAVRALDGTWEAMQKPVQQAFWETAGESLQEFADKVIPQFTKGLESSAKGAGKAFNEVIKAFNTIAISGDLEKMFGHLGILFDRIGTAAGPAVEAFNILGLRGSEFFPRFGDWIVDITTRFRDWIAESSRLGDITSWIEDGVNSLKDMWRSAGAIIDQFKAISRATGLIGNNGLDDFRRNMEYIAKVMLAEPFQSKLGTIFFGAREGARELNKGVKDLAGSFGDAASWTSQLLTLLGRFGGDVLSGVSRTFASMTFQQGVLEALRGMSDMVNNMNPAFDRLGDLLGSIGRISGSVFRGLAPVFNTLLGILSDSVGKIEGNLTKIAPSLLTLTNNLLNFARGPITLLVEVLNAFLTVLNGLPGPLRDAAVAFGTFLLLRNQFGAFATSLSNMWTKMTTSSVTGSAASAKAAAAVSTAVDGAHRSLVVLADGSVRQVNRFGGIINSGMARAQKAIHSFDAMPIVTGLQTAASRVGSIVGKINTSLALIGGIPGLVLGGIGVAMSVIGGNSAAAAANIDRLRDSLDHLDATPETLKIIAENISSINEAGDAWANFWRGVVRGASAGNETLNKLGINVGDAARIVAGSQADFDSFVGSLEAIRKAQNVAGFEEFFKSGKVPGGTEIFDPSNINGSGIKRLVPSEADINALREGKKAFDNLGISINDLPSGASIDLLREKMQEQRQQVELARIAQNIYAETLGVTSGKAAEVASIVEIIGDVSQDAAGKIDAINRSLAILNGEGLSEQEAKIERLDNLQAAVENAKAIAESIRASKDALFNANGLISEQSKAGRDLFKILRESADNVKIEAQAAYDTAIKNGDTALVAAQKAKAVVSSGRDDLKQIADAAGITVDQLYAQWDTFFGNDWQLTATFTATTDKFLAAKAEAEAQGLAFDGQEFMSWLLANPDPANVTLEAVKAHMRDYAAQKWDTTLGALDEPAQARLRSITGITQEQWVNKDWTAVMRAAEYIPGLASVLAQMNSSKGPYDALVRAFLDQGTAAATRAALDSLAGTRYATIAVNYQEIGRNPGLAFMQDGIDVRQAWGGILNRFGKGMFGFGPIKQYANGGIERHVAQITKPGGPVRVWSEKETHGEAYIPLALSKRPRSEAILAEVARKFGYQLTRAQNFANGDAGGHAVPTRTSQTSVTVGTINTVDPETAVKKLQQLQRDALAVAGIN